MHIGDKNSRCLPCLRIYIYICMDFHVYIVQQEHWVKILQHRTSCNHPLVIPLSSGVKVQFVHKNDYNMRYLLIVAHTSTTFIGQNDKNGWHL